MRDWFENQYQNIFLYVPFLLAGGGALYFSIANEPSLILAPFVFTAMIASLFIKRTPKIIRGILIFLFGFYYAAIFTHAINTPQLKHDIHNVDIIGNVKTIDYTDDKIRLYLNTSDNMNVRISVSDDTTQIPKVGDTVKINGGLFKPNAADAPETFDYARWSYFNNLTASGYANEIEIISSNKPSGINALRDNLHNKSNSFLADSLILGYKNAVPENDVSIWTATGVGHIWSISGFHMTLVGGWLFAIFYLIFRAIPYITRRIPAKIPAMGLAWCGLLFYLFLSGVDVATVRAFLMTTLIFLAFMVGRSAISMRNIALAFCLIFLINPHYVMQAGFQLSFSAVFGLVWLYSVIKPKMPQNKILKIIYACILTSLIATIFTAPFVAIHFGAIPTYGLISNLILLPIFSFAIMPLVLIGIIGALFGFHGALNLAHTIYDYAFNVAEWISQMPFANINVPHIPNTAVVCFVIGFMCLILIKNIKTPINIILFSVFITFGVLIVHFAPRPIFYATGDHELVAFLRDDGILEFNKSRASNHYFTFDTWKKINNQSVDTPNHRRKHVRGVYKFGNIVYIQKFVPLMKNITQLCNDNGVKYIVSYFKIDSPKCNHKILHDGFVIYPSGRVKYTPVKRRWHNLRV